jgi:hypothetical protein
LSKYHDQRRLLRYIAVKNMVNKAELSLPEPNGY